jgi:hypothetical protein
MTPTKLDELKKLSPEDEGPLDIQVFVYNQVLVLDFNKPITWFGMNKKTAIQIRDAINARLEEIE